MDVLQQHMRTAAAATTTTTDAAPGTASQATAANAALQQTAVAKHSTRVPAAVAAAAGAAVVLQMHLPPSAGGTAAGERVSPQIYDHIAPCTASSYPRQPCSCSCCQTSCSGPLKPPHCLGLQQLADVVLSQPIAAVPATSAPAAAAPSAVYCHAAGNALAGAPAGLAAAKGHENVTQEVEESISLSKLPQLSARLWAADLTTAAAADRMTAATAAAEVGVGSESAEQSTRLPLLLVSKGVGHDFVVAASVDQCCEAPVPAVPIRCKDGANSSSSGTWGERLSQQQQKEDQSQQQQRQSQQEQQESSPTTANAAGGLTLQHKLRPIICPSRRFTDVSPLAPSIFNKPAGPMFREVDSSTSHQASLQHHHPVSLLSLPGSSLVTSQACTPQSSSYSPWQYMPSSSYNARRSFGSVYNSQESNLRRRSGDAPVSGSLQLSPSHLSKILRDIRDEAEEALANQAAYIGNDGGSESGSLWRASLARLSGSWSRGTPRSATGAAAGAAGAGGWGGSRDSSSAHLPRVNSALRSSNRRCFETSKTSTPGRTNTPTTSTTVAAAAAHEVAERDFSFDAGDLPLASYDRSYHRNSSTSYIVIGSEPTSSSTVANVLQAGTTSSLTEDYGPVPTAANVVSSPIYIPVAAAAAGAISPSLRSRLSGAPEDWCIGDTVQQQLTAISAVDVTGSAGVRSPEALQGGCCCSSSEDIAASRDVYWDSCWGPGMDGRQSGCSPGGQQQQQQHQNQNQQRQQQQHQQQQQQQNQNHHQQQQQQQAQQQQHAPAPSGCLQWLGLRASRDGSCRLRAARGKKLPSVWNQVGPTFPHIGLHFLITCPLQAFPLTDSDIAHVMLASQQKDMHVIRQPDACCFLAICPLSAFKLGKLPAAYCSQMFSQGFWIYARVPGSSPCGELRRCCGVCKRKNHTNRSRPSVILADKPDNHTPTEFEGMLCHSFAPSLGRHHLPAVSSQVAQLTCHTALRAPVDCPVGLGPWCSPKQQPGT